MARAVGAKARLVVDDETTYGADPGAPDGRRVSILTIGVGAEQEVISDETLRGDRNPVMPIQGNVNVTGALTANLDETSAAILIKHALGQVVTTEIEDPFTHTITIGDLPISLVLNKEFTDIDEYHKFNGCRVSSIEFSATPEDFVEMTVNIIGQKETRAATAYDATTTEFAYKAFSSFQASLDEGGSPIGTVTNFNLTISNELDEDGFAIDGNNFRRDLPEGNVLVTGSIEVFFEDDTLLDKARLGTETSLKITLDKGATPARTCVIFVPELILARSNPAVDGAKGIKASFDFTAFFDDSTEASAVEIVLQNGLATI